MSKAGPYPIGAPYDILHFPAWSIRMEHWLKLNLEQESLEEQESVHVICSVYLVVTLPLKCFLLLSIIQE